MLCSTYGEPTAYAGGCRTIVGNARPVLCFGKTLDPRLRSEGAGHGWRSVMYTLSYTARMTRWVTLFRTRFEEARNRWQMTNLGKVEQGTTRNLKHWGRLNLTEEFRFSTHVHVDFSTKRTRATFLLETTSSNSSEIRTLGTQARSGPRKVTGAFSVAFFGTLTNRTIVEGHRGCCASSNGAPCTMLTHGLMATIPGKASFAFRFFKRATLGELCWGTQLEAPGRVGSTARTRHACQVVAGTRNS